MNTNQAYVYILKNDSGKFYIGSTNDLNRRLKQHKSGHTQTTHNMGSLKLVLKQSYPSLEVARKIEIKIKKLKRKDYIEKMVKEGYIRLEV
ncbi:MAG TPA: GIY-YIG nuclease family protein [Candidatus Paceibacterota bacterium]|nr:GIY-YIG nuclease family protein [Candidatus Paceibacterota bacterium]